MKHIGPVARLVLVLGGLVFGVVLFLAAAGGVLLTGSAALAASVITSPPTSVAGEDSERGSQEVSELLGELALSSSTRVSEAGLSRLLSAGLSGGGLGGRVELHTTAVEVQRGRVSLSVTATLREDMRLLGDGRPSVRLRPITSTVSAVMGVEEQGQGMVFALEGAQLGAVRVPRYVLQATLRHLETASPALPVEPVGATAVYVPFEAANPYMPAGLELRGLSLEPGAILMRLSVPQSLLDAASGEVAPLLREQMPAAREAVSAVLGTEAPALENVARLQEAVSRPRHAPSHPAALVSYTHGEVSARPPNEAAFMPTIGTDLPENTIVETEAASYAELLLTDRSVLKLDENTEVMLEAVPSSAGDARGRVAVEAGRLRARIARSVGTDFEFHAAGAVCGVRGTELVLSHAPGTRLDLSVLHGSVVLAPVDGPETAVAAGRRLAVDVSRLAESFDTPLETTELSDTERSAIDAELAISTPEVTQQDMRERIWMWNVADEARALAFQIMNMDEPTRRRLLGELEARLDMPAINARVAALLQDPAVREVVRDLGFDDEIQAFLHAR
jgi:hypothetical protein